MTLEELTRFYQELRTLEQQHCLLKYFFVGDEDYWVECCDWEGREIRFTATGNGYTVNPTAIMESDATDFAVTFRYYYPGDIFKILCATSDYSHAVNYLKTEYLRRALMQNNP